MDDWDNIPSDDEDEISKEALRCLRTGLLQVKNHDGATLRCPYSPSRKKRSYQYNELLQHANDVAKGHRGPEKVGKHCALAEYLRTDLASMASRPTQRAHKLDLRPPREEEVRDLLLFPWAGVIYNIETKMAEDGRRVGPSDAELKIWFKAFQPDSAKTRWDHKGHLGVGVIFFRKDFEGWKHAQAFEKWFMEKEHGRRDWERNRGYHLGTELYGWLARKEDYEGRDRNNSIAKGLRGKGPLELKDIGMVGEEMTKMHEAHIQHLAQAASERNLEFRKVLEEVEIAKLRAQDMRRQLEEKHRQELEEANKKAQQSTQDHRMQMRSQHEILQASMEKLSERCKELEEREKLMQTQVEKVQLEQEKIENNSRLEMLNKQKEVQSKHQAGMVKLIEKHEEENGVLEKWIQFKKLRLAEKHLYEFEGQRLDEIRDAENLIGFAKALDNQALFDGNALKELKEQISFIENQKASLQEQVVDLKEENESHNALIGALSMKERITNDELVKAKEEAIKAVQSVTKEKASCKICIKRMGEMEEEPWEEACKSRFKDHKDGWDTICAVKYSTWEDHLRDPKFHPFKMIEAGESHERHVDYSDEKLMELKEELGDKVLETVVVALEEMDKFNPSGRYPVNQVWNSEAGRLATLAECIEFLYSLIPKKGKKRKSVH